MVPELKGKPGRTIFEILSESPPDVQSHVLAAGLEAGIVSPHPMTSLPSTSVPQLNVRPGGNPPRMVLMRSQLRPLAPNNPVMRMLRPMTTVPRNQTCTVTRPGVSSASIPTAQSYPAHHSSAQGSLSVSAVADGQSSKEASSFKEAYAREMAAAKLRVESTEKNSADSDPCLEDTGDNNQSSTSTPPLSKPLHNDMDDTSNRKLLQIIRIEQERARRHSEAMDHKLNRIYDLVANSSLAKKPEGWPDLPLMTRERLFEFEYFLTKESNYDFAVSHLSVVAGRGKQEADMAINLCKLMIHPDLAETLNWQGSNNKLGIKNMKIGSVILDACCRQYEGNLVKKDCTGTISTFLRRYSKKHE